MESLDTLSTQIRFHNSQIIGIIDKVFKEKQVLSSGNSKFYQEMTKEFLKVDPKTVSLIENDLGLKQEQICELISNLIEETPKRPPVLLKSTLPPACLFTLKEIDLIDFSYQ